MEKNSSIWLPGELVELVEPCEHEVDAIRRVLAAGVRPFNAALARGARERALASPESADRAVRGAWERIELAIRAAGC